MSTPDNRAGIEVTHDPEIPVRLVRLWLCELCLDGKGGECHTPGCALFLNRAPDIGIRNSPMVTFLAAAQEPQPAPGTALPVELDRLLRQWRDAAGEAEDAPAGDHASRAEAQTLREVIRQVQATGLAASAPQPATSDADLRRRIGEVIKGLDHAYAAGSRTRMAVAKSNLAKILRDILDGTAAPDEPQPAPGLAAPDLEAAFANGMRVRTGPCTVEAHDREHFQVRTNGYWLCGHLLASVLTAQGIVASQEARPGWLVTDFDGYWKAQGYRTGTPFDREDLADAFSAGMQAQRDLGQDAIDAKLTAAADGTLSAAQRLFDVLAINRRLSTESARARAAIAAQERPAPELAAARDASDLEVAAIIAERNQLRAALERLAGNGGWNAREALAAIRPELTAAANGPAPQCPDCGSQERPERGYVPGFTGQPVGCGNEWHDQEDDNPEAAPGLAAAIDAERNRIRQMAIDLRAHAVTNSGKQIPFEEFLRQSPEENAAAIRAVIERTGLSS